MSDAPATELADLQRHPYAYDFVQAVRVLEQVRGGQAARPVGQDHAPAEEAVRFRVSPSLRNNSVQVVSVVAEADTYELTVPFLGMVGVNGVLPRHYSQAVLRRIKQHDYAMRDFLDLFHHRILSMYYRASVKYRLPIQFSATPDPRSKRFDPPTEALLSLVGLGLPELRGRQHFPDFRLLRYAGLFADRQPTAISLERMVADVLQLPTRVQQFTPEWLYIDARDQTRLGSIDGGCLGQDAVLGERVLSWQTRFRLRVGPVHWTRFRELMPDAAAVADLADLVRTYVGIDLDYDLQVIVQGDEIPPLLLDPEDPPSLGRTCWLQSRPVPRDADDATFDISQFRRLASC